MIVKTETSSMPCPAVFTEEGTEPGLNSQRLAASDHPKNHAIDRTHSIRIVHGLSQREEEILKSVVRGHSNKMIARTCGVTDATIKVHMKSILRKIRVANRTQAAIWALERGFGANASSHSPVLGHLEALATA
jgi:two-component system nitrate/nitrite response regulator NarL